MMGSVEPEVLVCNDACVNGSSALPESAGRSDETTHRGAVTVAAGPVG